MEPASCSKKLEKIVWKRPTSPMDPLLWYLFAGRFFFRNINPFAYCMMPVFFLSVPFVSVVMHNTHENSHKTQAEPLPRKEGDKSKKRIFPSLQNAAQNVVPPPTSKPCSHSPPVKCGHGSRSGPLVQESANFAKCLDQIQPTRSLGSSWFLASHNSPFSAMTSKI